MSKEDMALKIYLKDICKYNILTKQEEIQVIKKCKKGDEKAREVLVNCNLRLVVSIAKKYTNCGLPLADLIEEGNLGLLYAVERFDPKKECRFSTYATCWIKHSICRAITEKNQLIRIPAYMKKLLSQFKDISKENYDIATLNNLTEFTKLSRSKKKIVQEAFVTYRAMESMQSLQDINVNQDCVEDLKQQSDYQNFFNSSEHEWILNLLEQLGNKRSQVIKMRYGIGGNTPMTLKEIANIMNLTKERIRQIEKETLEMLRQVLETKSSQHINCSA